MIFTETIATTKKLCPLTALSGQSSTCSGSSCMAWRYVTPPKLEFTRRLGIDMVIHLVGNAPPDVDDHRAVYSFMREQLANKVVQFALCSVTDDWVCTAGPDIDEEGVLYAKFSRAFDDKATGYCGLAPIYPHPDRSAQS